MSSREKERLMEATMTSFKVRDRPRVFLDKEGHEVRGSENIYIISSLISISNLQINIEGSRYIGENMCRWLFLGFIDL